MNQNVGKVAMLHYTCPPVVGGVEAVMADHARLFAARGYLIKVIAGRGPLPDKTPSGVSTVIEPLLDSKNERLLALNAALDRGELPADFARYEDEVFQQLQDLLKGYSTCIVHNALTLHKNLPLTAALIRLSALSTTKFISWCHDLAWTNSLYAEVLHPGYPWNLLHTTSPAITYVAISPQRQQEIVKTFQPPLAAEAVPIIPNGIDFAEFLGISEETQLVIKAAQLDQARNQGGLLLLLPARITRRKNIELGIKVVAALKELGQNPRLIVTGPPGPHNPKNDVYVRELLALREELEVESEVVFLMEKWVDQAGQPRRLSDQVINELYRYSDALFFPSTQEGFGIPILEAALLHLPIFCSELEPFRQIAADLPHYFRVSEDPQSIAHRIIEQLNQNPYHRLRCIVIKNNLWDSIFEKQIEPLVNSKI
jgi:glycosyltransferase involved in cell wall biosynthesis